MNFNFKIFGRVLRIKNNYVPFHICIMGRQPCIVVCYGQMSCLVYMVECHECFVLVGSIIIITNFTMCNFTYNTCM